MFFFVCLSAVFVGGAGRHRSRLFIIAALDYNAGLDDRAHSAAGPFRFPPLFKTQSVRNITGMLSIHAHLAQELVAKETQVAAAVELLDAGAPVPFIARYRKEVTGGLDATQLRLLEERLRYLRELEERREVVLNSIEEQGKLTPELAAEIREADSN